MMVALIILVNQVVQEEEPVNLVQEQVVVIHPLQPLLKEIAQAEVLLILEAVEAVAEL